MNKPLLNKSKAFQKTVANFEQFFERKQPEPAQAEKKKPVPVVSTGNVGPQGYVRRSALKDGPPQPNRRNAPPSVTRAMGRQGVSRAPARREPQMDMEEDFEEEEEEEEEMSPEEFAAHIDELVSSATEEQSIALMQDAMEALDLTDQEKEALTDDDKREVVKEWVAHNFIEELANKQEEMDAEEEEEGLKEIDEYEDEDEQDSEKWLASLDPEDQELVSESLDAAATQYMRFYRREETLEPEYLEADVDFSLPPYGPPDGIQDGLHPYRPLFLAKTRPPHDFVRDDYSRSLPIKPRTLRKTVAALGPLRHAQAVVGHTASIDAYKKERLAKLVADVTSSS
ncbi:hypothetical protein CPB85DRAFT_13178 [Mucidula mucida]|nr:hypothetical protein CPB85DRAFT_13178 [Mucidula mucida]